MQACKKIFFTHLYIHTLQTLTHTRAHKQCWMYACDGYAFTEFSKWCTTTQPNEIEQLCEVANFFYLLLALSSHWRTLTSDCISKKHWFITEESKANSVWGLVPGYRQKCLCMCMRMSCQIYSTFSLKVNTSGKCCCLWLLIVDLFGAIWATKWQAGMIGNEKGDESTEWFD